MISEERRVGKEWYGMDPNGIIIKWKRMESSNGLEWNHQMDSNVERNGVE